MKIKILLLIIAVSLTAISCDAEFNEGGNSTIKLSKSSLYQPRIEESIIAGNYGVYVDYFQETDNLIGLSSSKSGPDNTHRIYGYSGPYKTNMTKGYGVSKFSVTINGNEFSEKAITKSSGFDVKSLFGTNAYFSINPPNVTKSDTDHVGVEMYIPKEIEITCPFIESEKKSLPLCYYDGLNLKWNADENNRNGVIVIIEWIGELVAGNDVPSTNIRRTMVAEDSGKVVLPNELFDGIPDTAVCHLTLLRGNIETLSIDDSSYKIQAESHDYLTFVLIREIKYV